MLEVEGLGVGYGQGRLRREIVSNVSFAVEEGQGFGFVGESGSGKSTILKALAGAALPSSGSVRWRGETVTPGRQGAMTVGMSLVFQDPSTALNPYQTVDQIVAEPLEIRGEQGISDRVTSALQSVALAVEHRYRFPHELSGGQRQRVAIARALVAEPRILLLDEPTSALDVPIQAEILNLLTRLRLERRLTIIMVSHDLSVVCHMCERVAVLDNGRIIETCDAEDIRRQEVSHETSRSLVEASFEF